MTHTQHDFELDKQCAQMLNDAVSSASSILNNFPRSESGLTPDSVRQTAEWQSAKRNYDLAVSNLRNFNASYVKKYKKELTKERKERIAELNRKFQQAKD